MIPIQPPIKRGQQGPEVANLQEALLFIFDKQALSIKPDQVTFLHAGLLQEKLKQIYSDFTAKTIETLQGLLQIDRTGEVDARTADALNKLLREFGAFGDAGMADVVRALEAQSQTLQAIDQDTDHLANIETKLGDLVPPASRQRVVSGQVRRGDDQPAQGVTVRALHVNERTAIRLGDGQTDDQGRYVIRYELLPGSDGISLRVAVLDDAGKTVLASEIVSPAGPVEVINLPLPMIEPDAATHRVDGRLLFDHGLPAPGVTLRLYQLGFGGAENATRLAETTTGEHGVYNLPYAAQGAANLEVRAVDAAGQEVSLSKIVRNAGEREVIHLVVPAAVQPADAEFTRLTTDVQPYVGEISRLASAQENSEFADLSVLHENTGWDARLIAMASTATKLSAAAETGLPADALYGLLRAGLPSDKLHLARVSSDAFDQALSKARATGIVSLSDPQVAQIKADFDTFSVNTRLTMQAPGSRATYGDMLKTLDLSDDEQQTFAKIYLNHRGDPAALWQAATDAGLGASVPKLQQQGKLAFLTTNNPELTAKLQSDLGADDPKQLVTMGLYKSSAWLDKIGVVPVAFADKPSYAEDLARRVRISYSTEVTWHMIETNDLKIEGQGFPATVGTFLKNAIAKGFKLGQMPVEQFIRANPDVLDGIPADQIASTRQMVKSLQRVYQITPGNDAMKALLNEGLTSAQDVLAYPLDVFLERFGPLFPSPEQAELVYRKAEQVSNVTTSLFTLARELENAPPVFAMSAAPEVREGVRNELIKRFPTLESLFGSLDFCECEHCRSVLSPAAYLVDLLQFLDHEPKVWENFLRDWKTKHGSAPYPFKNPAAFADAGSPGNTERTPYAILSERRPDLSNIPLTCENTQTALPHIDLVNEILEYYVAHNALQADAAKDTGDATTPELLAEPQNIEPQAYAALLKARYPLTLPFDLWLETARQFCNYFETPLWQLLETFRTGDDLLAPTQPYDRAATFIESLGLSPAEAAIFTNPQPLDAWFELYGYPNEAAALTVASDPASGQRIDLNSAKALARRLGVSYTELVEIIRTSFVNPALDALVILHKLGIAIDDVVFFRAHQTIYEQNKDLVGKPRSTLSPADQARYDALSKQAWNDVHEAHAFVQNLTGLKEQYPSFDADDWLNNQLPNIALDTILVLADPDAGCDFDQTTLQYADGVTPVDPAALLRINLFVRLWRKLGWTIEETDRALFAFVPKNAPFTAAHFSQQPLGTTLIYLAHLKALDAQVKVGKQSRQKLLALWTDLATTGKNPLYAQLFLTRSVLKTDPIFDDALGQYLTQAGLFINDHLLALQGALGVTADEIGRILADNSLDVTTAPLSLANVSLLYRYGLLAKALKLSIADVIALKQLSGLNPFTPLHADPLAQLADDYPFSQSLRFVEIVAQVKESGLSVADLEYLLRQRFDPAGKYRPNAEATLTLTKALAAGIRAIQREHAVPSDAGALTDELLRQKLGLALPADLVERFLAMLNGTVEFTATQSGVQPVDQLALASFVGEPAIRAVGYNAPRLEQSLTLRGVLFDDQKNQLNATFAATLTATQQATFAALLDDVQAQAHAFFAKYLQKQAVNATVNNGFLEASDFDLLFAPAANGLTETQQQTRLRDQRARLATTFLPFLQAQLTRQLVVQTMTAASGADAALIEALLTNPALLADPTQSDHALLDAFTAGAARGLTATFFAAPNLTGAETQLLYAEANTGLRDQANTLLRPVNSNSARFQGYLEVPTAGAYRFFALLDKQNATAELRFDHLLTPVFSGAAAQDGDELGKAAGEFVELKPGVPYRFTLDVQQLGGGEARLLVQGETLPKDGLARLTLYPDAAVDRSGRAQLLLAKSLQLIQALGLNERELRYLLTHAADFDNLALSALPTRAADDTPDKAVALFTQFLRLAGYARLQRALAGGGDDLITIFETAKTQTLDDAYALIAQVTRRETATVKASAQALFAAPTLADERALDRLWQALQIVDQLGVPVGAIIEWTKIVSAGATEPQRFAIARDLKETIKAGFEPETWQRIAQPIFDKLRQRQRDALVAHVMHQHDFERMEQLFEYFLIDPGMEPVVQTSRIRAAISAVQIFVQRCLLNLEPQVGPAAINAKHWQWMKRYRVWEANRKIFLFPENWLEPEFRDDKTHLFAELEGKLLQGDVSSDLVEDAFFNYLKKLDELARLDIVAMYCDEDALDPASNTLHVIGRTYGEPHKYFYRRYAQQMWTPWEPVSAEIEGNHIVPVIWRDRLNLFWVTFLERANPQDGTPSNPATAVADMKFGELQTAMKSTATLKLVDVQLHWSEYFQGEWSTRESGGYSASITQAVPASFNSTSVFIHATKEFVDGEERAVRIHLGDPVKRSFRVVSRNSRPEADALLPRPLMPYNAPTVQANRYSGSNALKVTFEQRIETEDGKAPIINKISPSILQNGGNFTLLPCANALTLGGAEIGSLVAPLFYQDNRSNTMFIEPTFKEQTIEEWQEWVTRTPEPEVSWDLPDWWKDLPLKSVYPKYKAPKLVDKGDPVWHGEIDPRARFELDATQDWATHAATVVQFNGELVGAAGRAGLAVMPAGTSAAAPEVQVNAGSAVAAGHTVGVIEQNDFALAGLAQAGGINVVGSSGLNSALMKNMTR